jgi:hypothetical protein
MNNLEFIVSYIQNAELGYTFDNVFHIGGFPVTSKLALSYLIHYIARETGKVFYINEYEEAIKIVIKLDEFESEIFKKQKQFGKQQGIPGLIWGDNDELSKLALQTRNSKAIEWYKLDELVCPNPFKENER